MEIPVDCEWGEWMIGECSASCGGGHRRRTRSPKIEANSGGWDCSGPSTSMDSCTLRECPGT